MTTTHIQTSPKTKGKTATKWGLILFGLVFFLAGAFVATMPAKSLTKSFLSMNWQPIEATVLDANLYVSRGSDGNTYRAEGQYRYIWKGETFSSERIFFGVGSDSERKFHNRIVRKLKQAKSQRQNIQVWVNPKAPGEAVYYRKIRWGMTAFMIVFSLIFMGVGGGIMLAGVYTQKEHVEGQIKRAHHPKEPWMWDDRWTSPVFKNNNKASAWGLTAVTIFWNLISLPLIVILPREIMDNQEYWLLIFLLFPIFGIGMIASSIAEHRKARRFGGTFFKLKTFPVALGHYMQGDIHIKNPLPHDTKLNVKLTCIHETESGSGDSSTTREDILWQDEQVIPYSAGRQRENFQIPVFFSIPDGQPESLEESGRSEYLWRLEIKAKLDGPDYVQDYEIPVFDPAKYPKIIPLPHPENSDEVRSQAFNSQGDWSNTSIVHRSYPEGEYYYFPPAQHKGIAATFSITGIFFAGPLLARLFVDISMIIVIVTLFFAAVCLFTALHLWLFKSAVDIADTTVTVRRVLFKGRVYEYGHADIVSLDLDSSMSAGTTKYYDITAKLASGKTIKLADNMLGRRNVESLMNKMRRDLGLIPENPAA